MLKKWIAGLLAAVLMCCAGCSGEKGETLTKVSVSEVAHSVFYAPQYVAMELGYFEEEGIELELVNGQGADKVMTAVLAGQVQIGLAGPEAAIYVYNEGRDDQPMVFAQLTNCDGAFLVGREPVENFSWDMLENSYIIGGRKGGVPLMTLEYVLKQKGLIPGENITVDTSVQFALMAGAFSGGTGDYVALFEPTATTVEEEGKGYVLASIGAESGEIPYTAYFANSSYLQAHPDVVQGFTNAIYKGQQWVDTHTPLEVAEKMLPYFPDTDLAVLENVAKRYKEIGAWKTDPLLQEEAFDRLQLVMQTAGELDQKVPYSGVVTTEFAEKAMK